MFLFSLLLLYKENSVTVAIESTLEFYSNLAGSLYKDDASYVVSMTEDKLLQVFCNNCNEIHLAQMNSGSKAKISYLCVHSDCRIGRGHQHHLWTSEDSNSLREEIKDQAAKSILDILDSKIPYKFSLDNSHSLLTFISRNIFPRYSLLFVK